jgi:hypothetical protein
MGERSVSKTEQIMLEIVLKNQALILRALYDHAQPAEFRQALWQAAELTENWVNAHAIAPRRKR